MASIMQGTTPSLTITMDPSDFSMSDVVEMDLKIRNTELKSYTLDDVTILSDQNGFVYHFTEAETTALDPKLPLIVQGRVFLNDGNIAGINKLWFNVADMMGVGTDG